MADGPPADFALLVPPGWVRLPLTADLPARIRRLADDRTAQLAPQERDAVRQLLIRTLTAEAGKARELGGVDLLLSVDPVRDVVVPASCLVTHVAADGRDRASLEQVLLDPDPDITIQELTIVEIAGEAAVRRLATRSLAAELVGTPVEGEEASLTILDVAVPIPRTHGMLLFSFGTPQGPLSESMVGLFDAIVGNLRWVTA